MNRTLGTAALSLSVLIVSHSAQAASAVSVAYGTITNVSQQEKDVSGGKAGGAVLGGMVGLYSGKGKSSSNKAAPLAARKSVLSPEARWPRARKAVYTVSLVEGGTVNVVMEGTFRTGDCVGVEQGGASANLRRVSDEFCRNSGSALQPYKAEHKKEADECAQAKKNLSGGANRRGSKGRTAEDEHPVPGLAICRETFPSSSRSIDVGRRVGSLTAS